MRKTIKIIDILCMINCEEEVPKEIIYNNTRYTYNESVQDYYDKEDNSLFEKGFTNLDTQTFLNRDVEILDEEDEFEDIEEVENCKIDDDTIRGLVKSLNELHIEYVNTINQLIKNQKKIIDKLNKQNI